MSELIGQVDIRNSVRSLASLAGCQWRQIRTISKLAHQALSSSEHNNRQVYPSGLTRDLRGFEVSLKVDPVRGTALRFVIDPFAWITRLQSSQEIAVKFAELWGNTAVDDVAMITEKYEADVEFSGNFRIWLGADVTSNGNATGKIYLNPWMADQSSGVYGIHKLLYDSKAATGYLSMFSNTLDICGPFTPSIVGLNFDRDGIRLTKCYVVLNRVSTDSLLRFATGRSSLIRRVLCLARHFEENEGQVHLTFSWSRDRSDPTLAYQFPTSPWLESRQSRYSASFDLFYSDGIALETSAFNGFEVSFVGAGESASYLYGTSASTSQ